MRIGQVINTQAEIQEAVDFISKNPTVEVKNIDGVLILAEKDIKARKIEELTALEQQTGLTRAIRELIIENQLKTSDYITEKVEILDELAENIRRGDVGETKE